MTHYTPQTFTIGDLDGISKETIEEHLKLYHGYVSNVNHIYELLAQRENMDTYALKESYRRLAFEFDGMRNHEYYFSLLSDGPHDLSDSPLKQALEAEFGSVESWLSYFKDTVAKTRGVGWAILGYDKKTENLINYWVDEQHLGHLTGITPIIALDMWEHSYCMDYPPSKKGDYIEAFFTNLNWKKAEEFYEQAQ